MLEKLHGLTSKILAQSDTYAGAIVATGGSSRLHATDDFQLTVFSFGCCYMSLPIATGGHKLTVFLVVAATGRYQSLQVDTS